MNKSRTPDPIVRLLSHALVGGAAAFAIHKAFPQTTAVAQVIGMLLAAAMHEQLDAPVANWIEANTDL